MPNARANGIQIEYETFGNSSNPAILLIIGIGCQMILWDEEICEKLAAGGLYVIRFDNRDVGLSSKLERGEIPNILSAISSLQRGEPIVAPYTLDDMADDSVGLLDALNIQKAHICGMSMGGMIAQAIAIRHSARLLSLISIYSRTGNPELPLPHPDIFSLLLAAPPNEKNAYVDEMVRRYRIFSGPNFPFDETWHRHKLAEGYDRSFYLPGFARQYLAIIASGNRKPALAAVTAPTLVIHGLDDPLVLVAGGRDTAEAIPGAKLMLIEGMGHALPHGPVWHRIAEAIIAHTQKAWG